MGICWVLLSAGPADGLAPLSAGAYPGIVMTKINP